MITSVLVVPLSRALVEELSGRILPESEFQQMVESAMSELSKSINHPIITLGFASLIYAVEKRLLALYKKEEKLGQLRYIHQYGSEDEVIKKATQNLPYIIGIGEAMSCVDILVSEFDQTTLTLVMPYVATKSVQLYQQVLAENIEIENELVC